MSSNNSESIQQIREKFLTESVTNPQLYHPIDIKRVENDDWQVNRFILDNNSEEEAFNELTRVLKWKNSYGLHERTDEYFPRELFQIFCHEKYSRDKNGRIVSWNIENRYRKVTDFTHLFQQFLCHQLEKLDLNAGINGWYCVSDCLDVGYANIDMSLNNFRTDQLKQYPKGMKLSLNVDLPWIMGSALNVVKNFMDKKTKDSLKNVKRDQLTQYVDIESIPECFGGKRKCSKDDIKHLKPLRECNHLGFTDKQMETFYKTYSFLKIDE